MSILKFNNFSGSRSSGFYSVFSLMLNKPWLWSYISSILIFSIILLVSGGLGVDELIYTTLTFSAFSVIVGIGQMFVITLGPGNVDLSIPSTMTLAATISLKVMDSNNEMIFFGFAIALLVGLICGSINFILILALRIPPIIATLSSSFLYQSLAIWSNRGLRIKPPELLSDFTSNGFFGVSNVAIIAFIIAIITWFFLENLIFGRWVVAIGQNMRAAQLSGVPINSVRFKVYLLCAVLASISGFFLASFSGGASLNMGSEYLLMSISVVVIGGCSIAGGNSNIPGIWGASLFMFLIVSMLNTIGLGAGVRLTVTGLIIVFIVSLVNKRGGNK